MAQTPELLFATFAASPPAIRQALLLADSLRAFGGCLGAGPFWLLTPPDASPDPERLEALNVAHIPISLEPEIIEFPFGAKTLAAGRAEERAEGACKQLVWLDFNSIFVQEPEPLRLPAGAQLGCRPVDHRNIGSLYDQPLDPFWARIYALVGVAPDRVYPIATSTAPAEPIRPYYNAGMLVLRPAAGLLRAWAAAFRAHYQDPELRALYAADPRYAIFVHQAILSALIIRDLDREQVAILPPAVNYALHLHDEYPADLRPAALNDLVSFRYEDFFEDPDWQSKIGVREPLAGWLRERVEFTK